MRLFSLCCSLVGLSLLAPTQAVPDWKRVLPSKGHVAFTAVQEGSAGKSYVHSEPKSFTLEFGNKVGWVEMEEERDETMGPEILVSADMWGLPSQAKGYAILIEADGTHTELVRKLQGTGRNVHSMWKKGGDAKTMLEAAMRDTHMHDFLYKFEAVQRLSSPKGLMHEIMMAVFDPEGYTHYTQTTDGGVIKREYDIDVPNDSSKHYDDAHLARLYTTWEAVLGKDNASANAARHLAAFRTPVKSAHVVTCENEKGWMWMHSIALYSSKTPKGTRPLSDTILEFVSETPL